MAGLEIAFQVRETASFVAGSQEIEPSIGWRYDLILQALVSANGNLTPRQLCQKIVGAYIEGMRDYKIRLVTQSAIDIAEMVNFAAAMNDLGRLLSSMMRNEYLSIAQSEKRATRFYDTDFWMSATLLAS